MMRRGFTLIEIVLAIGLTATVVYLLTTAIELYLVNVDASRTRVESAQLARTLLDQIAADLAAARTGAPAAGPGPAGGPTSPAGGAGATGGPVSGGGLQPSSPPGAAPPAGSSAPTAGGPAPPGAPAGGGASTAPALGLFGDVEQLRIDRAAYVNWERAARDVDPQEAAATADHPVTVRYFLVDADHLTAARLAAQGVAQEATAANVAGLYRETIPTAAIAPGDPPLPAVDASRNGAQIALLAPEVVAFSLAYYNGAELVDEWDAQLDRGLPIGVEIRLTIAEPSFQSRPDSDEQRRLDEGRFRDSELVEYRRFVRLPLVAPSPPAQPLLPAPQNGSPGAAPGQPGGAAPPGTPPPAGAPS